MIHLHPRFYALLQDLKLSIVRFDNLIVTKTKRMVVIQPTDKVGPPKA
jgi:hypothetical protein